MTPAEGKSVAKMKRFGITESEEECRYRVRRDRSRQRKVYPRW